MLTKTVIGKKSDAHVNKESSHFASRLKKSDSNTLPNIPSCICVSRIKIYLIRVPSTVPTRHKLTPERTPKADPGFALSSLGVHCGSSFQKSASALGPLGVRSGSALSPLGVRYASALGGWSGLNNSKIRDTILRDENVCVSRPGFDVCTIVLKGRIFFNNVIYPSCI